MQLTCARHRFGVWRSVAAQRRKSETAEEEEEEEEERGTKKLRALWLPPNSPLLGPVPNSHQLGRFGEEEEEEDGGSTEPFSARVFLLTLTPSSSLMSFHSSVRSTSSSRSSKVSSMRAA
jgi:hypothetical protein